ncbi:MAG: hypothetical protein JWN40_2445 [Phycisphaerales bacterium]|nr:hypothetical protein [Phycisphaerales bacterium]
MNRASFLTTLLALTLSATLASAASNTPNQAIGFFGTITGTVKSARSDGASFVLTVDKADPDEKQSAIKDGGPMVGKEITLGTRMPRDTAGTPHPSAEDVAYIKTLKPGAKVIVKVFAVRADPTVLRLRAPGESADAAAPSKEKPKDAK